MDAYLQIKTRFPQMHALKEVIASVKDVHVMIKRNSLGET